MRTLCILLSYFATSSEYLRIKIIRNHFPFVIVNNFSEI